MTQTLRIHALVHVLFLSGSLKTSARPTIAINIETVASVKVIGSTYSDCSPAKEKRIPPIPKAVRTYPTIWT